MSVNYQQYPFLQGKHPPGWVETSIGEIMLEIRSGYSSGVHNQDGKGIPHLRPMNVTADGEITLEEVRYISPTVGSLRLAKEDILFTNTSSTAWVGKTGLVENSGDWGFSNHMTRLRVASDMSPDFVARQIHYLCMSGYFAFHCKKFVNQSSVAGNKLGETVPFRLPPAEEQKRIAAKLRRLLARQQKLRHQLEALILLTQRYRVAVLEAASTGRLVPTQVALARKRRLNTNPVFLSLESILAKRRAEWEVNQLAKMRAHGREPGDNKWKEHYREPMKPQSSSLPNLPEQWCWAGTEELTAGIDNAMTIGPFGSNLKVKDYQKSGVPLIFVREIRSENFKRDDSRFISHEKANALDSHKVRAGDVLIAKMGEHVGDTSIYPIGYPDAIATADCVKLTPNLAATSANYLKYIIRSPIVKDQILAISRGVAHQKMSLTRFKTVAIPLPPMEEQRRIVQQIERSFSAMDKIESQINIALEYLTSLRTSFYHRALDGTLVEQRVDSESAKELLTRIRTERKMRPEISKNTETQRKVKMKKISPESVREAISKLPQNQFSFEDLSIMLDADYDPLKNIVFELLAAPNPTLRQVFDPSAKRMKFEKITL